MRALANNECASYLWRMGKPLTQTAGPKSGWEPTFSQIAERANRLWHHDGCPRGPDLRYWIEARQQLQTEHAQLIAAEDYPARAAAGLQPRL